MNMPKKNESVTKEYLDKRFVEHSQIIVSAVGEMLDKKLDKVKTELKNDINSVQTLIDGYVKAQEDFREEFVIMKEELKKIKEFIKKKFKLEIKAV